ncbi:hypothetical protein [Bacteroides neonati]|uniref:hypothetical protein n=1 Tax=Bacteroides neonati TaxID=1347393 RepID=UPI0005A63E7D|nr:hypothetical protein [Bacteroides neonati]
MKDAHDLGTFETLERVWDLYPYGGCPGDYITIAGVVIYWNDDRRVWGDSGDHVSTTEDQHVEGGLIVDGNLTIGGSTKGKSASFTMLKVESLEVENPPYAEMIHDHDDVYAKKGDIPSVDGYATQKWVERKGYLTNLDLNGYATEDWVESKISSSAPSLPIASSSILGGVKIGKNISINKDGVISADNVYELTKDKILSVLRDENGLISLDANLALSGGLVNYANLGNVDLPSIYDGIPIDGTTIGRDSSGALTVLGGVGSDFDATQMWTSLSGSGAEQINKSHLTEALAGYARTSDIPSLTGYATESWVNDKGYVTTTRLNELIGGASSAFDTLKEIEDYINSHESVTAGLIASLGNKVDKVTGMGLSEHSFTTALRDKLNSIADGANKYILPVAKAAVLGGVMIGSNINVNAQGVISVEAPYSHPTQKAITAGAARHFLTGLAVKEYGQMS